MLCSMFRYIRDAEWMGDWKKNKPDIYLQTDK